MILSSSVLDQTGLVLFWLNTDHLVCGGFDERRRGRGGGGIVHVVSY